MTLVIDTVRSEWTKLRSLRGNVVMVALVLGLTVGLTALFAAVAHTDASAAGEGNDDIVQYSLTGMLLGQLAVATFAVLAIASEYSTGAIRTTFLARPRRSAVVVSKTALVAAIVLAVGAVACVTAFLVAQPLLHDGGYGPPAYPTVSLTDPLVLRAVLGSAVFLAGVAVIGVAVGAIVRRPAGAISVVFGVLVAPWLVGGFLPEWIRELVRASSPVAGIEIQSTVPRVDNLPVGPWGGLAVTWAWAIGLLLVALWVVERRDA